MALWTIRKQIKTIVAKKPFHPVNMLTSVVAQNEDHLEYGYSDIKGTH